ncbi:hypothetical protein [Bacillus safensis]|uniref:hypothetical protein n=1 Tax=Bacillus safensis TaxID=561879 RepID=UPI00148EA7C5|nr:hypothetical protein [Bacillus safensis]NOL36437.1 hypothetical protein [Bacillus safensis]
MSIKEALFLTEEAEKTLKEIEEMQERAMSENLERPLAFKIKYFLDFSEFRIGLHSILYF